MDNTNEMNPDLEKEESSLEKNEESSVYKREEIISYLNNREKELGTYIKNFFSETFSHILKD